MVYPPHLKMNSARKSQSQQRISTGFPPSGECKT
jgi:hypothetical protein